MYSTEIYHALKSIASFGGIRSADQTEGLRPDKYYILNTDPSYKRGKHWVAIYMGETPEFFDSLGRRPEHYNFRDLLVNGSRRRDYGYLYNSKRLQNRNSRVCGEYCIFYVWLRSCGYSIDDIVNRFDDNLKYNDEVVSNFHVNM